MLSKSLLNSLRPPKVRNAAEWAEAFAYLPEGDANAGKYKNRPYQRELLRAMSLGSRLYANGEPIREIVLLKSAQVGYSLSLLNSLFYHVHYRPTTIGLYFPNSDSVKAYASNQVARYIAAQPCLEGIVTAEATSDGKSATNKKIFPGGVLRMLSASKGMDVATHTLQLVYGDEIDSWGVVKGEGDPMVLIANRTKEFSNSLMVWGSTPRGSFDESRVWGLYKDSDMRRFYLPCPRCGKFQYLAWRQFVIGESDYNDSGFRCVDESCNHLMKDQDKYDMLEQGVWKATNTNGVPGRAGYNIWAAYSDSPTVSWPRLARMREQCEGDREKTVSFYNTTLGLPVSSGDPNAVKADSILEHVADSPYLSVTGVTDVPNDVSLITCGVDIQSSSTTGRLEYGLYGWSRHHCYFLAHAAIPGDFRENSVWDALDAITGATYTTQDGKKKLKVSVTFVDSGDGLTTHTVYYICQKRENYFPIKGNSHISNPLFKYSQTQNSNQFVYHLQTVIAKDKIQSMLRDFVGGKPDSEIVLPADLDPFVAYGYCSEIRKVNQGNPPRAIYVHHNKAVKNEPLDCFVYALCAKEAFCSPYHPDRLWKTLERRAKGKYGSKEGKKTVKQGKSVDFGGFL